MSWIRKQIERLLRESARRQRLVRGGVVAAVTVALVVTAALVRGVTAAGPGDVPGEMVAGLGAMWGNEDTQTSDGQTQVTGDEEGSAGEQASDEGEATDDTQEEATDTSTEEVADASGAKALPVSALNAVTTNDVTTNEVTATDSDANPSKGTLTSATFSDGNTSISGSVAAGTRVNFSLTFEFDPNVMSENDNTVTYTLPEGIDVSTSDGAERDINGTGQQAGKKLGTFKIENGVVTMTFSNEEEENLFNETITTTLQFWGTATNDSLTDAVDYNFDGKGTLHVDPVEPTLQVSKGVTKQRDPNANNGNGGDLADGDGNRNRHANYTITVGTTTGTRGTVTIDDSMATNTNVETISYDSDTFTLKKYASANDSTGTVVSYESYSSQLNVTAGQHASFTLSGLPALAAGERYELTYSATVTETDHTADSSATNNVTVKDDGSSVTASGSATATWSNKGDLHVEKRATVTDYVKPENPNERHIEYQIITWSNTGSMTRIQIGDTATAGTNVDTSSWRGHETESFYDHDSFKLRKYSGAYTSEQTIDPSDGTDETDKLTNLDFNNDSGKPSLGLYISEPLNANEYYVLTYTGIVYETDHNAPDTRMDNGAVARFYPGGTETVAGRVSAVAQWHNEIQKTGTFNQSTGRIDWVVTVNRNGGDARGTVMEDTLQYALASNVQINQGNTLVKTLDLLSGEHSVATEGYDSDPSTYNTESGLLHVVLGSWATSTGAYTIRFSTQAPADGTVSNSAAYIKNGTTYGSQGISVGVNRVTEWGITKAQGSDSGSYDREAGAYKMSWNINATFPDEDLTPDGDNGVLKLHDTFGSVTNEDGTTSSQYTGAHYAIAKDLYAELTGLSDDTTVTLTLHNDVDSSGNVRVYTLNNGVFSTGSGADQITLDGVQINLTFYDASGNTIDNPSMSEDHVASFDMVLTRTNGETINGQVLTVTGYHSLVSGASLPTSEQLNVTNSLSSNHTSGATTERQGFMTLSNPMEKQVRTLDNRGDNRDADFRDRTRFEDGWQDTAAGDYATMSGNQKAAQFRIALNTMDYPDNATVTITDTLPEGMQITTSTNNGTSDVDHPIRLVYGTNVGTISANYTVKENTLSVPYSGTNLSVATSASGGRQVVTFTFALSDSLEKGQYYITYTASYADDSAWDYASTTQRSYTNTASATIGGKDYTSSSTLNVTRDAAPVTKYAYGTITNDRKASYRVVINPAGQDLATNSDTITITDQLTGLDLTRMNPELDLSSIHLYRYSDTATNNLGAEIDRTRYTVQYDHESTRSMTITVPDSTALVLTYTYEFKPGASGDWGSQISGSDDYGTTVGNTASFGGSSSSSVNQSIRRSSAGGTAYTRALYLYKVDKDNYANTLTGSLFDLYKAEAQSAAWTQVRSGITGGTETGGTYSPTQIALSGNDSLQNDVIYALVETTAPTGYGKTVRYVVWLNQNETEDAAWTTIAGSTSANAAAPKLDTDGNVVSDTSISRSDVTFIPYEGGSIYVEDERTGVTVTKNWNATDGSSLDANSSELPESITLQLKRTTTGSTDWENYGEAVTVTKDSGWSHSWTDLAKSDGSGNPYIYKVEEVNATGQWKATYLNNDGITTGNITITNTRQYSLPSTGGVPLTVVWATGGMLAAGAAIALVVRKLSR